jgi:hypothetical protein
MLQLEENLHFQNYANLYLASEHLHSDMGI